MPCTPKIIGEQGPGEFASAKGAVNTDPISVSDATKASRVRIRILVILIVSLQITTGQIEAPCQGSLRRPPRRFGGTSWDRPGGGDAHHPRIVGPGSVGPLDP